MCEALSSLSVFPEQLRLPDSIYSNMTFSREHFKLKQAVIVLNFISLSLVSLWPCRSKSRNTQRVMLTGSALVNKDDQVPQAALTLSPGTAPTSPCRLDTHSHVCSPGACEAALGHWVSNIPPATTP